MLNTLSLNVGEFFAESSTKKSWLINKKSLTDGVRECLQEQSVLNTSSGQASADQAFAIRYFVSQSARKTAHSDFDHIAFFVTSGFENLLGLSVPTNQHAFSRSSKNLISLSHADSTFGINERSDASGKVLRPIAIADLEFIFSKLQLLSIRDIAVGFLHSNLNSENEKQVANFFSAKGLQVYCSYEEDKNLTEIERWQNTLSKARMSYRQKQVETQLQTLCSQFENLDIQCANPIEKYRSNKKTKCYSTFFLDDLALEPLEARLYLGLEDFLLKDVSGTSELGLSATSVIASGFYNTPEFSDEVTSYDPGPMIMGKSFVPSLIDLLFATGNLSKVENFGLSAVSADRAKPRILESILALVRNNQERKHIDIQKEILNLEKILGYRIWAEALKLSNFKRLKVSGPLAESLLKVIKTCRPPGVEVSL